MNSHHCERCQVDVYPTKKMGTLWTCLKDTCGAENPFPGHWTTGQPLTCSTCKAAGNPATRHSGFVQRCPSCGNEHLRPLNEEPAQERPSSEVASNASRPETPARRTQESAPKFEHLDSAIAWMHGRAATLDAEIEAHERALVDLRRDRARIAAMLGAIETADSVGDVARMN